MKQMTMSGIFVLTTLITLALLAAGCTQPLPAIPGTQPATTTTGPGGPSLNPGPTDVVPASQGLLITVSRNTLTFDPKIKVEFRGGAGMNAVNTIDIKVTRSDGTVSTATLAKPRVGDFVELKGTTGKDRVEATARMISGDVYRIYDDALQFRE